MKQDIIGIIFELSKRKINGHLIENKSLFELGLSPEIAALILYRISEKSNVALEVFEKKCKSFSVNELLEVIKSEK